MKKILNVTKVAFYGQTGDDRCPESMPFPACMTSLLETLEETKEVVIIHAHDMSYTKRLNNDRLLAASGMAFGLLWEKGHCYSALDMTQVTDLEETIKRAFDFAGYTYRLLNPQEMEKEEIRHEVVEAINEGKPVLGFGVFVQPECVIIAGYDKDGEVLLGWSHFQGEAGVTFEENGMFRLGNWEKNGWALVIPGEKVGRKLTDQDVVAHGLEIMKQTNIDGYMAGTAAYEEWKTSIREAYKIDDGARQELYGYHHAILFSLAELRCYGGTYLREAGANEAGDIFQQIHDTCWKADAVTGSEGAAGLASEEKCQQLVTVLDEIEALDQKAQEAMKMYLNK